VGSKSPKTLILGLGNTILTDDGVGIYIAREIAKRIDDPNVSIHEASLGGLELLDPMLGFDRAILIDAYATENGELGSVIRMNAEDLKGGSAMARHQVPFHEALELGHRLRMDLPQEIIIYGIKVKDTMTFGESCTPEVQSQIPNIVQTIINKEFSDSQMKD